MWEASSEEINVYVRDILRIAFPRVINVYIVHPRLEIGDFRVGYPLNLDCVQPIGSRKLTVTSGLSSGKTVTSQLSAEFRLMNSY